MRKERCQQRDLVAEMGGKASLNGRNTKHLVLAVVFLAAEKVLRY